MHPRTLLLLLFLAVSRQAAIAAPFTSEQHQTFDGVVETTLSGSRETGFNVDALLKALGEAYENSGYSKDATSREVRQHFVMEGAKLKELIRQLDSAVGALRPRDDIPAVMVYVLSREQAASFQWYKWCRSVIELTDLANASIQRNDAEGSQLATLVMRAAEAQQDTISTAIETIADKVLDMPGMP